MTVAAQVPPGQRHRASAFHAVRPDGVALAVDLDRAAALGAGSDGGVRVECAGGWQEEHKKDRSSSTHSREVRGPRIVALPRRLVTERYGIATVDDGEDGWRVA